ncbi:acetyl-CoA carboxylase biotin carboxylase subunit family protein [Amycolatopsis sp. cmx-4-68]|uniref:ATP-grasp domain-containing protein n=1 Tax=Amycolatopsis sp. cmx-4-68 TaxID=2790938 RepID=UPI003977E68B
MRVLVLHQNKFERMGYDIAIDHDVHDVVYAGAKEYVAGIPAGLRCETVVWDPALPVAEQLIPWVKEHGPFGRVIARHEKTIMPAAVLRAEFGIPGMLPAEAINFRDKVAMKRTLAAAGIRVPRFRKAGEIAPEAEWAGKTIVKPRDEGGSQGVELFATYQDAYAFVEEQRAKDPDGSFADRYEVEEFLEGPIWHVDGFLHEGRPAVVQASQYVGVPLDFEHGQPIGSVQHPKPELEAWAVECVRALGGRTLTFHLEAIMTDSGPAFMEVAARCGGSYIVETLERKYGINLHVLDMASDVDGRLATRFLRAEPAPEWFGIFLYPGRRYRGAPVEVSVPAERLRDRRLVAHTMRDPHTPTRTSHSYRPEDLPFSGLVTDTDPEALDEWLRGLFGEVTVTPRSEEMSS